MLPKCWRRNAWRENGVRLGTVLGVIIAAVLRAQHHGMLIVGGGGGR